MRDSGASPAGPRPKHTISQMTIHRTAVVLGDNSNMIARLSDQRHHRTRRLIDIAHHMAVDRRNISVPRDWNRSCDTCHQR